MNKTKQILQLGILFVTPFYVEDILTITSNEGNMGLNGLYLGIYIKRNVLYLSFLFILLSYLFSFKYLLFFSFILFMLSLFSFLYYIIVWFNYLKIMNN